MSPRRRMNPNTEGQESSRGKSQESAIEIRMFTSSKSGLSKYGLWELERILNDPDLSLPRRDFRIIEVPADKNHELMERMNIYALPTTIVGNQKIVGIPDEQTLLLALDEYLTSGPS